MLDILSNLRSELLTAATLGETSCRFATSRIAMAKLKNCSLRPLASWIKDCKASCGQGGRAAWTRQAISSILDQIAWSAET